MVGGGDSPAKPFTSTLGNGRKEVKAEVATGRGSHITGEAVTGRGEVSC